MNTYYVRSLQARLRTSMGKFAVTADLIQAKTAEEAEEKFRAMYETNAPTVVYLHAKGGGDASEQG